MCKTDNQCGLIYDTGHPKSVLCENLEGRNGREVGGGFRMEGRHIHADGRFILMYYKNHHNIYCEVIIPQLKLINLRNALLPEYTKIAQLCTCFLPI